MLKRTNHLLSRAHRQASTSSYSINNCPYRSFAKNHPAAAKLVLVPPPPQTSILTPIDFNSTNYEGESLEKYLEWRGWDTKIKNIFDEHQIEHELIEAAVGLASHPLTFPLTLGRHVKHFLTDSNVNEREVNNNGIRKSCRICCVGARSECTLPDEFWREFLIMANNVLYKQNNIDENAQRRDGFIEDDIDFSFEWIIDFVGPDVPRQLQTKTISLIDQGETHAQQSLTMNFHSSFLHQLVLQLLQQLHGKAGDNRISPNVDRLEIIRQYWDGFILFNPGLGHPNLASQWDSTIKFLLKTNKPMLLTAHSRMDALRDLAVIKDRGASIIGEYESNPYSSKMEFVDPFPTNHESVHVVRPNHSVLLLKASE